MQETCFKAKFGKREYSFQLGHAQLYELETGAEWRDDPGLRQLALMHAQLTADRARGPIPKLFARLRSGDWTMPDVTHTIRLALIGGGASAEEAQTLVAGHVLDRPLAASVQLAIAAVGAALVGKKEAAAA
ncbi:MAG TPA: GTA-gp10 family protein [Rhizomicrobium sp.]|jgi:hypothetical protein|nr:GTA-gp10 family protein [Rhizomicrobium sp.]